jgi:4-hydroxy-tetrahydrodipicolinate synthase
MGRRTFLGTVAGTAAAAGGLIAAGADLQAQSRPATAGAQKNGEPFRGIFTIPCTTFREDGELDIPSFRRQIDFCIQCGAHGLVFPVNASEWTSLSDDERFQLDKVLVEQNAGRLPVVIGVNAPTAEIAAKFAAHAREIGASAVIALPPRGVGAMPVIFNFYRRISDAARLPVFVQDHDAPVGTPMSAEFLIRLCREIEHVKYIKEESSPSTLKMTAVTQGAHGVCKGIFGGAGGRYLVEEHLRGCSGQMPGCHVTDVVVAFWNALEAGDDARAMHIYKEMSPLFFAETLGLGYKEVLLRRGVISCAFRRNGVGQLDPISSKYLDRILKDLAPLMTWKA